MTEIYVEKYDYKSIVNVFRDVRDSLDKTLSEKSVLLEQKDSNDIKYQVSLKFVDQNGAMQSLIKRSYDNKSIVNLEVDINDGLEYVDIVKNNHGAYTGEYTMTIGV